MKNTFMKKNKVNMINSSKYVSFDEAYIFIQMSNDMSNE